MFSSRSLVVLALTFRPMILFFSFLFWPRCKACGILVPQPGIEPVPPAMEAPRPNHWTAREVPHDPLF